MANKDNAKQNVKVGGFYPDEAISSMWDQQLERVDAVYDEYGRRQVQAVEQVSRAIGELAKMTQDSIQFSNQMSQELFKAARGTTRWASDFMGSWAR